MIDFIKSLCIVQVYQYGISVYPFAEPGENVVKMGQQLGQATPTFTKSMLMIAENVIVINDIRFLQILSHIVIIWEVSATGR